MSFSKNLPFLSKTTLEQFSVASFSPVTASGTAVETSCAKKPSTIVLVSTFQLNLYGFKVFNLVIPSDIET